MVRRYTIMHEHDMELGLHNILRKMFHANVLDMYGNNSHLLHITYIPGLHSLIYKMYKL